MESKAEWNTKRFTDTHVNTVEALTDWGQAGRSYPKPQISMSNAVVAIPPNTVSGNSHANAWGYNLTDEYNEVVDALNALIYGDSGEEKFGKETNPTVASSNTKPNAVLTGVLNDMENDMEAGADDIRLRFEQLATGVNYDDFTIAEFRILCKKILNFFPELIDTIVHSIALSFVDIFYAAEVVSQVSVASFDNATGKPHRSRSINNSRQYDIYVLKTQIYSMLAIPFTYVVAYNWWYLFNDNVPYVNLSQKVQENKVTDFFLDSILTPTHYANKWLLGSKQRFIGRTLGGLLKRFRPFLCLIVCGFIVMTYFAVFYTTGYFKKTMVDAIDSNDNTLYSLIFSMVIISFVFNKIFFMNKAIIPGILAAFKALTNPITFIVMRILQFVGILVFVPLSMVCFMLYLLVHSLFGIMMYGGGMGAWSTVLHKIDSDVKNTIPEVNETCFKDPMYMKVLRWLNKYLYDYRMYILFGIAFIVNIVSLFSDIKSESLKLSVMWIYLFILVVYFSLFGWRILDDFTKWKKSRKTE